MRKTNYHTHTYLCGHAVGKVEDYILKAIELNMEEIGFSDHNPVPNFMLSEKERKENWTDQYMSLDSFTSEYLDDLKICKNKYGNQIKIYSGLECEYLPKFFKYYEFLRSTLDYLNLGMHYYVFNNKVYNTYESCNYDNVDGYFDTAIKAMESGLFRIMVHPDLFFFNYKDKNGNHIFDEKLERLSRKLIEAAIKNNVALEVNCGGIKNTIKYKPNATSWAYPRSEFFKIASQYKDLEIVIGIDAHDPNELNGKAIDLVENFVEKLGLDIKCKINI